MLIILGITLSANRLLLVAGAMAGAVISQFVEYCSGARYYE